MRVNVLEGQVTLTTADTTINVPAGAVGIVPLDENGLANGAPTLEGYSDEAVAALTAPVTLFPQEIEMANALTENDLAQLLVGAPRSGDWLVIEEAKEVQCGSSFSMIMSDRSYTIPIRTNRDGSNVTLGGMNLSGSLTLQLTSKGVYTGEEVREFSKPEGDGNYSYQLNVLSTTSAEFIETIEVPSKGCSFPPLVQTLTFAG